MFSNKVHPAPTASARIIHIIHWTNENITSGIFSKCFKLVQRCCKVVQKSWIKTNHTIVWVLYLHLAEDILKQVHVSCQVKANNPSSFNDSKLAGNEFYDLISEIIFCLFFPSYHFSLLFTRGAAKHPIYWWAELPSLSLPGKSEAFQTLSHFIACFFVVFFYMHRSWNQLEHVTAFCRLKS